MHLRTALLARFITGALVTSALVGIPTQPVSAETAPTVTQADLVGPAGSVAFGATVTVLTNGNYVVTDPLFGNGAATQVGAVYLYDGMTDQVISTLTGTSDDDEVGSEIVALSNGNFVVISPDWSTGPTTSVGAVTWVDGAIGLSGTVSAANSLVGSAEDDFVGDGGVVELANGNYVVRSFDWANGGAARAGAVTWASGASGIVGPVSSTNSLVGDSSNDRVGSFGLDTLPSGDYVVSSRDWDSPTLIDVGAVTWASGTGGTVGAVSSANSLVGASTSDRVGNSDSVTVLTNGNYAVASPMWRNGVISEAGAVTWASGTAPTVGEVSTANSLYGTTAEDRIGGDTNGGVTPLANGNYVVSSPRWDNGATQNVGAITWADGDTGLVGAVTTTNSLYGATIGDLAGGAGTTALTNGNYVVNTNLWDNGGTLNVGAVTWGNGATGTTGEITATNSLHGTTAFDFVGIDGSTALTNGNYVVTSSSWNKPGDASAGAVTWGDGAVGSSGAVTTSNSIYGDTGSDRIGSSGVVALTNGNYVVASPRWTGGATNGLGAATWGDGATGTAGMVSSTNSLVGTQSGDRVADGRIVALANGNYVVKSSDWANGSTDAAGAVTWGDGSSGTSGQVNAANSLVGTTEGDEVGSGDSSVTPLSGGDYVVRSTEWNNGTPTSRFGALTWADGESGISGAVSTSNSLVGSTPSDFVADGVTELETGDFVAVSSSWDDGAAVNAGAATLGIEGVGVTGPITSSNSATGTPPGSVEQPTSPLLTSNDAVPVPTNQNRVLLLQIDRGPTFPSSPVDVTAATSPGDDTAAVDFATPTATDLRSTPTVVCAPASGSTFDTGDTRVTCTAIDSAGFTAQTAFTVTVTATPADTGPDIVSLTPARLLETRPGEVTADGQEQLGATIPADSFIEVQIAGREGVPTDATAAVINVTAINPNNRGFITLYPCGTQPLASSLNYPSAGTVIANEVIAKLSPTGTICAYTLRTTHLAFDVVGYVPTTSNYVSLDPARLLETRPGEVTADGQEQLGATIPADSFIEVQIAGREGVPTDATAAVINVTAINPNNRGFITLYPCGTQPLASSLNYPSAGTVIANEVIAKLSPTGTICAYTLRTTHLAFDVVGYVPTTSNYVSLDPARLLETRPGEVTADGQEQLGATIPADSFIEVQIAGREGVPTDATAAVINVTAINPNNRGFITLYPCGTQPLASSLNYPSAGTVIANEVIAKLSPTGTICAYTLRTTHLAFDVVGYVPT